MFKNSKDKEVNYISAEEVEKMYEFQKKSFEAKLLDQQKKIDELTDYISARFGEKVVDSDIGSRLNEFEETIKKIENTYKNNLKKNAKDLKKELEKETQKIATELNDNQTEWYFKFLQKNEEDNEKIQNLLAKKEENSEKIANLDNLIKTHIEESTENKKEMQEELKNTKQKINKINYAGITSKCDKKIKEECLKLNEKIEEMNNKNKEKRTNMEECFAKEIEQLRSHLQTSSDEMIKLQELFVNENEKTNETKEKHSKNISEINEKITEITGNFNGRLNELELITKKEINEQKTNTENIDSAIEIINSTMGQNYEIIGQELLKLKEETKLNLEKSKNNITNIEILKKDYNKYVTKMNNELNKLSKSIVNVQKKSLETNQNLQVKIKGYIDNKIIKIDNTKKIENLINNLNISTQEREKTQKLQIEEIINNLDLTIRAREKAQKLEMEELFNKKLKAIQKENERILQKKIEEVSSKFIKENTASENVFNEDINPNKVTFYTESPKNKKNIYEFIDNNQVLRKTAKSKGNLEYPEEGKTQKIKFFYDEEN